MSPTYRIGARLAAAYAVAVALILTLILAPLSRGDLMPDPNPRSLPTDIDSPELEVTSSLGFDGAIWQNAISPVTFQIKNISPDFFSGTIEIKTNRYSQQVHRLPIEVGQNSLRRFSLGITLPSYIDGLDLRIVRDGKPVWKRTLNSTSINPIPALRYDRPPPILAVSTDHTKASVNQSDPVYRNREIFRIAPWQLPDHEPILNPIGGVFLAETVDLRSLAGPRIKALALYVAHGGTLFVPEKSAPWMQKFADELPYEFTVSPVAPTPVGLGLLVPYGSEDKRPPWAQKQLLDILTARPAPNYAESFQSHQYASNGRGPRSQNSISTITLFVIGYLVAAGPLLFFFRRAKRKNVIRVLVIIIGAASILSVVLGIFLRSSRGDLAWSSMTRLGDGGATQTAVLSLSSAGARSHNIDTGADHATIDTFDFLPHRYIHPSNFQNSDQSLGRVYQGSITAPFPLKSADIKVPPLGTKRIHARGPIPGIRPLEIEIRSVGTNRNRNVVTLDVSIKNPNPFPITSPKFAYVTKVSGRIGGRTNPTTYVFNLPTISASGTISGEFPSQRQENFDSFRMNLQGYNPPKPRAPRPLFAPNLPTPSTGNSAVFIFLGTLKKSPGFDIAGDFAEFTGSHYITQELPLPPDS